MEVYWKDTSQIYHAILYFWRFIGKKLIQTHIQAKYTMLYYTFEVYWKETNTNTHASQIYHAILYFWRFIGMKLIQTHIQAKYTMLYYTFRPLVAPSRKTNEVHSVCIELFLPYFYLSFQIRQQYRKYLMHEIFEIHSFTKKSI